MFVFLKFYLKIKTTDISVLHEYKIKKTTNYIKPNYDKSVLILQKNKN